MVGTQPGHAEGDARSSHVVRGAVRPARGRRRCRHHPARPAEDERHQRPGAGRAASRGGRGRPSATTSRPWSSTAASGSSPPATTSRRWPSCPTPTWSTHLELGAVGGDRRRAHPQAGRRRRHRLRAGRRVRARPGRRRAHRRRRRDLRPARGPARHHPRRRRHPAPEPARRPQPGQGHHLHRPLREGRRGAGHRPRRPARAGRRRLRRGRAPGPRQFATAASYAVRAAKEAIDRGLEVDLETGLEIERLQFAGSSPPRTAPSG